MAIQNLLAITGNQYPHKYFVNQLGSHFKRWLSSAPNSFLQYFHIRHRL